MAPSQSQDQPPGVDAAGPIATDRPAVTNSSVVVPAGSLQMENGFLETGSQGQSIVDGPESLVRFGIAKRIELRLTLPDHFHNLTASGGSGFGDVAIGVKQQLGPPPGKFDVSVILFLSFPSGQYRVQRRVRSGSSGAMVTCAVRSLDGGWNVLSLLAHSKRHAKRNRRGHVLVG